MRAPIKDCPQPETPLREVHRGVPEWVKNGLNPPVTTRTEREQDHHHILVYLGISGWIVVTIILGIMALAKGGWIS